MLTQCLRMAVHLMCDVSVVFFFSLLLGRSVSESLVVVGSNDSRDQPMSTMMFFLRLHPLVHSVAFEHRTSKSMVGIPYTLYLYKAIHTHTNGRRHLPIKHFKNWHVDRISHDNGDGNSNNNSNNVAHWVLFESIELLHLRFSSSVVIR